MKKSIFAFIVLVLLLSALSGSSASGGLLTTDGFWDAEDVIYIEPNNIPAFAPLNDARPNDKHYDKQWALEAINAPAIWENGITGKGVRVAVLDTGIVFSHEDINYAYVDNGYNYNGGYYNGLGEYITYYDVTDRTGHGSMVTGVICAARNNGVGIAGMLDQVTIVPLRVTGDGGGTPWTIANAIRDAVDVYNCDVINMSFLAAPYIHDIQAISEAVAYAASKNVIMVAGVGNFGNETVYYPAGFDEVIGVGSIDQDGTVSDFSQHNRSVFVTAPGRMIATITNTGPSDYVYVSGTSLSTPFVTAMAAVAKSVRHDITVEEFKTLLMETSVDAGEPGYDEYYGYGVIDFEAFIDALPESNWILGFRDISGHWASESIKYVVGQGLYNGTTTYTFEPDLQMTRAMFVTVLGRLCESRGGTTETGAENEFTDVQDNSWYSRYVTWASEYGLVEGYGNGLFGPNDNITREQMVAVLYRFSAFSGMDMTGGSAELDSFADNTGVSDWARESMGWAISQNLINGIEENNELYLRPKTNATRSQVAVIIHRYCSSNLTLKS